MTNKSFSRRFLSLPLLVGIFAFAVMSLMLGGIFEDVVDHEPLTLMDTQLSNWLHNNRTPSLTKAMLVFTFFGSTGAVSCIAVAFLLYLIWQRRFRWLAVVGSAVFGGMLLNQLLKYAFHRPRPYFDDPILTLTGYSFPSGHTMMATGLYGVLAVYLFTTTSDRRGRLLIIIAAALLIGLVGFSRIYLGAHYLSDVLAAMAEGLTWLSLCLIVISSFRRVSGNQKKTG
jgi:membrane-associated phospholipid phosphatase